MSVFAVEKKIAEERRHLKSQLRDLQVAAWSAGNPALLYCGACEAAVSPEEAIEGPLRNWPYCPLHEHKALMIHAASARAAASTPDERMAACNR